MSIGQRASLSCYITYVVTIFGHLPVFFFLFFNVFSYATFS